MREGKQHCGSLPCVLADRSWGSDGPHGSAQPVEGMIWVGVAQGATPANTTLPDEAGSMVNW